jgi:hypothetical protein
MCIAGYLSDFSLPKIFQLLEKGQQTGLLTIRPCLPTQANSTLYYIWVYQGRLVAAANRLNHQGLVALIAQRKWIDRRILAQFVQSCPIAQPLGSYLKQNNVLQAKQLKSLFQVQVLHAMRALFQLKDAQYGFNANVSLPTQEMTGLSLSAIEAILIVLREVQRSHSSRGKDSLPNRGAFAYSLSDPNRGLINICSHPPRCRLNALEWRIWEYTNGTVSLKAIARQLKLPLNQVQQIAFRLIAAGLVEEVTLRVDTASTKASDKLPAQLLQEAERRNISHLFLQNLEEFLGSQT